MSESVAFKEWKVICEALMEGRQTLILRKGGIHEASFTFQHRQFWLFPTHFHAQGEAVKTDFCEPLPEWQVGDEIQLDAFAELVETVELKDWKKIEALKEHHIWTEETLRQRFEWEGRGMSEGSLHLAVVRVSRLKEPLMLSYEKKYGGCRSWVDLPIESYQGMLSNPVLSDIEFEEKHAQIRACY